MSEISTDTPEAPKPEAPVDPAPRRFACCRGRCHPAALLLVVLGVAMLMAVCAGAAHERHGDRDGRWSRGGGMHMRGYEGRGMMYGGEEKGGGYEGMMGDDSEGSGRGGTEGMMGGGPAAMMGGDPMANMAARQVVMSRALDSLGVTPEKLAKAMGDQVDALEKDGALTSDQADALRASIKLQLAATGDRPAS